MKVNLNLYTLKESRLFFTTNFYSLKNKFCLEREYLFIHGKILLKFIDTSSNIIDFFNLISEDKFKYLLNYIYNKTFPEIQNKELNIYLELLFYAKFFKIKSLFKVNRNFY